ARKADPEHQAVVEQLRTLRETNQEALNEAIHDSTVTELYEQIDGLTQTDIDDYKRIVEDAFGIKISNEKIDHALKDIAELRRVEAIEASKKLEMSEAQNNFLSDGDPERFVAEVREIEERYKRILEVDSRQSGVKPDNAP